MLTWIIRTAPISAFSNALDSGGQVSSLIIAHINRVHSMGQSSEVEKDANRPRFNFDNFRLEGYTLHDPSLLNPVDSFQFDDVRTELGHII